MIELLRVLSHAMLMNDDNKPESEQLWEQRGLRSEQLRTNWSEWLAHDTHC